MALTVADAEVSGGRQGKVGVGGAVAKGGGSNRARLVGRLHLYRHCRGQGSRIGGKEEEHVWELAADGVSGGDVAARLVFSARGGQPTLLLRGGSNVGEA